MSEGFAPNSDGWRACEAIAETMRDLSRLLRDSAVLAWIRGRCCEAVEYEQRRTAEEKQITAKRERHAHKISSAQCKKRRLYLGQKEKGQKKPRKNGRKKGQRKWEVIGDKPPKGKDKWYFDRVPIHAKDGSTCWVAGWYPPSKEVPAPVVDTPMGSVALLAKLHDMCLCDTLEPENPGRILDDETTAEVLEPLLVAGLAQLSPDEVRRRLEIVQGELERANVSNEKPNVLAENALDKTTGPGAGKTGTPGKRERRGRKPHTDANADAKLNEAWQTHDYNSFDQLDAAMGLSKGESKRAVDRHRHRLSKRR